MKTRISCKTDGCRKWAKINEEGFCPACKPADVELISVCNICKENIDETESEIKFLGCDLCDQWYHPKCAGPDDLLTLLDSLTAEKDGDS